MTTLSSLNRHACATLEDVGSPKVIATQKFFKKIAPWAQYVEIPLIIISANKLELKLKSDYGERINRNRG
jgi:tRNA A37 threonylcarbamoyladenosine dehydratase